LWNIEPKIEKKNDKTLKLPRSPYFFDFFEKKTFSNQTLGLRKSLLNQTTYAQKNLLQQQPFLNRDSFLNRAFLNQDSTVQIYQVLTNDNEICIPSLCSILLAVPVDL